MIEQKTRKYFKSEKRNQKITHLLQHISYCNQR